MAASPQTLTLPAFEALVDRHYRTLLAYARAQVADGAAAEDIVQEALLVAFRRRADFRADADFAAWVRGIVRFKVREWRRRRHEAPLSEAVLDGIESVHDAWSAGDARFNPLDALTACLERLDAALRQTIERFYVQGSPVAAIAESLASRPEAVRKRLERARGQLADCIDRRMQAARTQP